MTLNVKLVESLMQLENKEITIPDIEINNKRLFGILKEHFPDIVISETPIHDDGTEMITRAIPFPKEMELGSDECFNHLASIIKDNDMIMTHFYVCSLMPERDGVNWLKLRGAFR